MLTNSYVASRLIFQGKGFVDFEYIMSANTHFCICYMYKLFAAVLICMVWKPAVVILQNSMYCQRFRGI